MEKPEDPEAAETTVEPEEDGLRPEEKPFPENGFMGGLFQGAGFKLGPVM